MLDKVNNKINIITDIKKELKRINDKVNKNIQQIYERIFFKLPDDPKLRQADLNKIDAKIDDALNFVWNKICGKNKISSKKINKDKYKDFDRYVSNKLDLLERVDKLLYDIINEIENKVNKVNKDLYKAYKKGIDKIHLANSKLSEFMRQLKKGIRNIISLADLHQK